jgi:hypothetical protein
MVLAGFIAWIGVLISIPADMPIAFFTFIVTGILLVIAGIMRFSLGKQTEKESKI